MKKVVLITVLALLTFTGAFAGENDSRDQKFDKEQFVKKRCNEIADDLALIGDKRDAFVKLYANFAKEINEIAATRTRTDRCRTENEVERAIMNNFEVSERIIEVRRNYYTKFKKILLPSQIQLMYKSEFSHGGRNHGGYSSKPVSRHCETCPKTDAICK